MQEKLSYGGNIHIFASHEAERLIPQALEITTKAPYPSVNTLFFLEVSEKREEGKAVRKVLRGDIRDMGDVVFFAGIWGAYVLGRVGVKLMRRGALEYLARKNSSGKWF